MISDLNTSMLSIILLLKNKIKHDVFTKLQSSM